MKKQITVMDVRDRWAVVQEFTLCIPLRTLFSSSFRPSRVSFFKQMKLPVSSLKFLVAFHRYYWAQIPELIEELADGVEGGEEWMNRRTHLPFHATYISGRIRFPGYYLEFQLRSCNCRCMRQFSLPPPPLILQVCVCLLMDKTTVLSTIMLDATLV